MDFFLQFFRKLQEKNDTEFKKPEVDISFLRDLAAILILTLFWGKLQKRFLKGYLRPIPKYAHQRPFLTDFA